MCAASLLEWARAGEAGFELGDWNAAYLLDRGLASPHVGPPRAVAAAAAAEGDGAALPLPTAAAAPPENDSAGAGEPSPAPPAGLLEAIFAALRRAVAALVPTPRAARPPPGAKRRALRLYLRAASQGNAMAELAVGDAYFYGRGGLPVSLPDAVERYHTACANHIPEVRGGAAGAAGSCGWSLAVREQGSSPELSECLPLSLFDAGLLLAGAAVRGGARRGA